MISSTPPSPTCLPICHSPHAFIFNCDYFDTKSALPFFLTLMSSPDCVSGLWSESESPPPGTTVVPEVDRVDVNQPSDLDPIVSVQTLPSSVPSLVSSYFRYGLPVVQCITSPEHFSGLCPSFGWFACYCSCLPPC